MRIFCQPWHLTTNYKIIMKKFLTRPILALAALATVGAGAGAGALASAQTASTTDTTTSATASKSGFERGMMGGRGMHHGHGAMGTVTAVNGNTITITRPDGSTATIDATNATVSKVVTTSLSDVNVGDRIGARGTTSGTNVAATDIMTDLPEKPADAPVAPTAQ